jgi:hypothetical protein
LLTGKRKMMKAKPVSFPVQCMQSFLSMTCCIRITSSRETLKATWKFINTKMIIHAFQEGDSTESSKLTLAHTPAILWCFLHKRENKKINVATCWDTAPCTDISEERITFSGSKLSRASHLLHAGFLFGWYSTLKMEVIRSYETSIHIRTTWSYISEDVSIHKYRYENITSYKINIVW